MTHTVIRLDRLCACGCGHSFVARNSNAKYASVLCMYQHRGALRKRAESQQKPQGPTDTVIRRALAAYGWSDGEPLPTSATFEIHARLWYVVLRRRGRVLACYRVRNDGKLKRLIRLPDFG